MKQMDNCYISNEMQDRGSPCTPSAQSTRIKEHGILPKGQISPNSSVSRLWRPAAQRNLRNQWSKLASQRDRWFSASSLGRDQATSLVNAYLSQRYMPKMELGTLSKMPEICTKASEKLHLRQVNVVCCMHDLCASMRCFLEGSSESPFLKFCSQHESPDDDGCGGGLPVFTFLTIPLFEQLGRELFDMFKLELIIKRLLVVELLSVDIGRYKREADCKLAWSDELFPREFEELLTKVGLHTGQYGSLCPPKISGWHSSESVAEGPCFPDRDILQVYLTAWLVEVNIDRSRVDEIFGLVSEEMHARFS